VACSITVHVAIGIAVLIASLAAEVDRQCQRHSIARARDDDQPIPPGCSLRAHSAIATGLPNVVAPLTLEHERNARSSSRPLIPDLPQGRPLLILR
jgi:hypothetical protein